MKACFPLSPHGMWVFKYFAVSPSRKALFVHNVFLSSSLLAVKHQSWKHQKCIFSLSLPWRSYRKINTHTIMLQMSLEILIWKVLYLFLSEH